MTDQTKPDPVLPPLPAPAAADPGRFGAMWTGDQMQAYGYACYAQARADLIAELRPVAVARIHPSPGVIPDVEITCAGRTYLLDDPRIATSGVPLAIIPEK